MTAIAGVVADDGDVWIGGDSAGVYGWQITQRADAKVFKNGPYIFGFTSSFRMGQVLRYMLKPPRPPRDPKPDQLMKFLVVDFVDELRKTMKAAGFSHIENNEESGGTFLLGVAGRLFDIEDDFQVGESLDGFAAVGVGDEYALGSLHTTRDMEYATPRERLTWALQAAAYFSGGVSEPFNFVHLGRKAR